MKSFAFPARALPAFVRRSARPLLGLVVSLAAAALLGPVARAQTTTTAVPGYITYQGRVFTSSGALVGAGTPVNRIVIFRVWGHQSNSTAADLVYSEQQTVTIAEGEFSVLIGQGTAVSGTPLGYSEASKGPPTTKLDAVSVFAGINRYLGVTVDDGSATADPEISPRQQMVTAAYAFRSKYAESLGANGSSQLAITDQGNVGIGLTNPTFPLTFAATLGDKLGLSGAANYGIGLQANLVQIHGAAAADDIAFGHGTSAALTETVRFKGNGNVGIGTSSPVTRLDVNGVIGVFDGGTKSRNAGLQTENNGQIFNVGVNDSSNNRFGGAYTSAEQGGFLRLDTRSGQNLFQFHSRAAAATTTPAEIVSITSAGNVGIGRTAPAAKLDVNGAIAATSLATSGSLAGTNLRVSGQASTHAHGTWLEWDAATGAASLLNQRTGYNGGIIFGEVNSGTTVTEQMRITAAGSVGIGTNSPATTLDVRSAAPAITVGTTGGTNGAVYLGNSSHGLARSYPSSGPANNNIGLYTTSGDVYLSAAGQSASQFVLRSDGTVGIGTSSPTQAKLVVSGVAGAETIGNHGSLSTGGATNSIGSYNLGDASIRATGAVHAIYFRAVSDARIKRSQGRSDGASDLARLNQIEITDYTYIDRVAHGGRPNKRLIGQQVESVFPQAVSHTTDVVADIYQPATLKDGWVELATDLKPGERVRLLDDQAGEIFDVLEVQASRFRTNYPGRNGKVLVYGREVRDFRVVDYEAVAMLNVSATQELTRQVDTLQSANAALTARLAELDARDRAREAKLASLERLMQSTQTVMARPAAANNNGQE